MRKAEAVEQPPRGDEIWNGLHALNFKIRPCQHRFQRGSSEVPAVVVKKVAVSLSHHPPRKRIEAWYLHKEHPAGCGDFTGKTQLMLGITHVFEYVEVADDVERIALKTADRVGQVAAPNG